MRWLLAAALVPIALAAAHADAFDTVPPGVTGNDTGGIISWAPGAGRVFRDLAFAHCAQYNKIAVISSTRHRYGEYIGFRCYHTRSYDPRKAFLYYGY